MCYIFVYLSLRLCVRQINLNISKPDLDLSHLSQEESQIRRACLKYRISQELNPFCKRRGRSGWSLLWMSGWNLFHSNGRNLFYNSGQNLFQICLEYVSVVPRKGSISEVCASLCLRNLILSYEGKSFKKCGLDLDWNSGFCRNCPISLSQNDFFQSSSSFENLSLSR